MAVKIYVDQETLNKQLDPIKKDIELIYTLIDPFVSQLTVETDELKINDRLISQNFIVNED